MTDYIIKAETPGTALNTAGENISDALLIAIVLNGLAELYRVFVTQSETRDNFQKFKQALRNFEETEWARII